MKLTYEELELAVLELPLEQKAKLSRVLNAIYLVNQEQDGTTEEVAQAWEEEVSRRWNEFESGKSTAIPAEVVLTKARALLLK